MATFFASLNYGEITLRLPGSDSQWNDNDKIQWIRSMASERGHGLLYFSDGKVLASGTVNSVKNRLVIYTAPENDGMIALIGNKEDILLCVKDGFLSTRIGKSKEFINIKDAGDDVKFKIESVTKNIIRFKSKKDGGYVGFNKEGEPLKLSDVDPKSDEAEFFNEEKAN